MRILLTGATGQLGREVVPRLLNKGHKVDIIVRNAPKYIEMFPIKEAVLGIKTGDVTLHMLGLEDISAGEYGAMIHLAADVYLGTKKTSQVWHTNFDGTMNVIQLCEAMSIPELYYCSSAFTFGNNRYEESKIATEDLVSKSTIPKRTIFKPGVIVPNGESLRPTLGAFYDFAKGLCTVHQRAETVRRWVEGTLLLPPIVPKFRVLGNPLGEISLVPVGPVAEFVAESLSMKPGRYYLTHPDAPTVGDVCSWIGDALMVDIEVLEEFKMSTIEALFHRAAKAFLPYTQGYAFPSDLSPHRVEPITREFIIETVRNCILDAKV